MASHWSRNSRPVIQQSAEPSLPLVRSRTTPKLALIRTSSLPLHFQVKQPDYQLQTEDALQQILRSTFDSESPTVDLSNCNILAFGSWVSDIACYSPVRPDGSFFPGIQLFLNNNLLTELPEVFFSLANVSVLSLRGNQIEQIPSLVHRFQNLHELSLSNNSISYLPGDVLFLKNLKLLMIHPNPLFDESRAAEFNAAHSTLKPADLVELCLRSSKSSDSLCQEQPCPSALVAERQKQKTTCTNCKGAIYESFTSFIRLMAVADVERVPLLFTLCSAGCSVELEKKLCSTMD